MNKSKECEGAVADASSVTPTWFLAGQFGSRTGMSHVPITENPFSIGRRTGVSLCLPFRTVSSIHAELRMDEGRLLLRDLNSTNGTFVNGERIEQEIEVRCDDLLQFADIPVRVHSQATESVTATIAEDLHDGAFALVQLDKLMSGNHVNPHYQPIIDLDTEETIAYEVLGRSDLVGVQTPKAMFRAAEKLNLEIQLSRMLRWEGIRQGQSFPSAPHLFVNTHPAELTAPGLIESLRSIREACPSQVMTLEIHEGAVTDDDYMLELREALDELKVKLAYDDFGAGQARLAELVKVRPEYLKFDISLIQGADVAGSPHNQMVGSLVKIVRDLGIIPLAEGVETLEQSEACRDLGFQLVQGFWYGKPAPAICS